MAHNIHLLRPRKRTVFSVVLGVFEILFKWFLKNEMALNTGKCDCMCQGNNANTNDTLHLCALKLFLSISILLPANKIND